MKRYSTIMSVLLTLALPVAGSCADAPKAPEKTDASVETTQGTKPEAAKETKSKVQMIQDSMSKTGHGAMMGGSSSTGDQNPSGKVVEALSGGGYAYANLEKGGKKTWVAFPPQDVAVGDTLSFKGCTEMHDFPSKALNRKFESIYFCGAPEATPSAKKAAKKSPGSQGATASSAGKIAVEKAKGANAYTVAEIFAKRAALNGKQVVVRGQVIKTSSGIMNKNWIHLQDGTGSEKQKTNDLVVTSSELPATGEVITISGTVAKDKDFGSGYKYNVIIEKGTVKK